MVTNNILVLFNGRQYYLDYKGNKFFKLPSSEKLVAMFSILWTMKHDENGGSNMKLPVISLLNNILKLPSTPPHHFKEHWMF